MIFYDFLEKVYAESEEEKTPIMKAVADEDMGKLIRNSGYSQTTFSRITNIPLRTVQHWCAKEHDNPNIRGERRKAPKYLIQMVGYILTVMEEEEK